MTDTLHAMTAAEGDGIASCVGDGLCFRFGGLILKRFESQAAPTVLLLVSLQLFQIYYVISAQEISGQGRFV